jgi:ferredoxin--NADP+ reductase
VDIEVRPGELDLDAFDPTGQSTQLAESDRRVRGNLAAMRDWAGRPAGGAGRRLVLRFWLRPVEVTGTERVSGLTVERTRLDEQGRFTGTGEYETIPAQMVFRSVGYQSVPLAGVPFDENTATVPHAEGRVLGPDGAPLPGEYVAGWLKRGPTGVVGTNKSDAAGTVRSLLADLSAGAAAGQARAAGEGGDAGAGSGAGPSRRPFTEVLAERGIQPVSYVDWLRVEAAEAELAGALGRGERVKIGDREAIEALCRPFAG